MADADLKIVPRLLVDHGHDLWAIYSCENMGCARRLVAGLGRPYTAGEGATLLSPTLTKLTAGCVW